jgi:hypothetical protein
MVQHDPKYYDTGDPTEPLNPDWFQFKQWSQPWKDDIDGKQPKAPRCYHVEHVLEWQVFKQFVEADKDKNDDSRCALLQKYFKQNLPSFDYKVQVAKGSGELNSKYDRFYYEEKKYEFGKFKVGTNTQPRMIDWISM